MSGFWWALIALVTAPGVIYLRIRVWQATEKRFPDRDNHETQPTKASDEDSLD